MAATATPENTVALDGYDRMELPELFTKFRLCSQVELTQIEAYERAHEDRRMVLDKLRYLRGREPFAGYDELSPDEILTSCAEADISSLHDARGYEQKLRHREEVLDGLGDLRRARRAGEAAPGEESKEPAPFVADLGNPIARIAASIGMSVILLVAVVLFVCSIFIGAIVVISAIAPSLLG